MKKFILPGLIILFSLSILSSFSSSATAFLGFNEGGGSSVDCYKVLQNATRDSKEVIEWSAEKEQFFKYTSQKVINKQDGSFCLLQRGQPKNDLFHDEQEVKITYFSSKDKALSQVNALKGQERADFAVSSSDSQGYQGITQNKGAYLPGGPPPFYEIEGETYARDVKALGNCVAEVKFLDHTERHGYTVESRQAFFDLMKLFMIDPAQRLMDKYISVNSEILAFCGAKASTTVSSGQSNQVTAKKQQTSNLVEKADQGIGGFVRDVQNYFKPSGVNAGKDVKPDFSVDKPPFKDPKTIAEESKMSGPVQAINSWIEEIFGESAPVVKISDPETLNRTPKLSEKEVGEAKQKFDSQKSPYQIPVLDGEAMVKLPGSNDWTLLKEGDRIVPGSTLFTAWDTRMLLMIRDKGIVEVLSFTEITVSEQGLEQADKEGKTSTDVKLHTGEIEVNVEGGVLPATLQIQTTNVVAGVRGTHFWVNYNSSKGASIVGVYRGTVDVKDNLGSEKAISPQNDKTEAVLVSKQFSTKKLILYGLMVVVAGGLIIFLRRKGMKTLVSSKKTPR